MHISLPPDLGAPAAARSTTKRFVDGLSMNGRRDDVVLVVSELVSNAVLHGEGPVTLDLEADHETVRVGVHDHGSGCPRVSERVGDCAGGLGLHIVDRICEAWGVERTPKGKRVWALFRRALASPEPGAW